MESFSRYLDHFPVVFLKPSLGGGGKGVFKISRAKRRYELQSGNRRQFVNRIHHLYHKINKAIAGRKYLIQEGINLIALGGRPMDFRILLLKPDNDWVVMGIMGKLAARNKVVTNHCRGGSSITLNNALIPSLRFSTKQCSELKTKLKDLSLQIAYSLENQFRNITELGLDIAIDSNEHVWLLEANTKPHFELFKHHEDPTLYRKIYRMVKRLRSKQKLAEPSSTPLRILLPKQDASKETKPLLLQ